MTAAIKKLHAEARKLALELTYPATLTAAREEYIYARLTEIDGLIYG